MPSSVDLNLDWARPVILLDFDGVLNSLQFIGAQQRASGNRDTNTVDWFVRWHTRLIDPALASKVASLVRDYQCSVIVCSSWRDWFDDDQLRAILAAHDIPFHGSNARKTYPRNNSRYREVRDLVRKFPPGSNWVVIDDAVDSLMFEGRVVQPKDGLTDADMARARAILDRGQAP